MGGGGGVRGGRQKGLKGISARVGCVREGGRREGGVSVKMGESCH